MKRNKKSGFTLVELLIVIVILGVMIALALPRFLQTIEKSRSLEAVRKLGQIREAMDRCYQGSNNTNSCALTNLDADDPSGDANSHFTYSLTTNAASPTMYTIVALRSTELDGGNNAANLTLREDYNGMTITKNSNFYNFR